MTQKATIPKQHSLLTQIVFNTGLAIKLDINGIEIIKSAQLSDKIALQLTEEEKNGKKIILLWKTVQLMNSPERRLRLIAIGFRPQILQQENIQINSSSSSFSSNQNKIKSLLDINEIQKIVKKSNP